MICFKSHYKLISNFLSQILGLFQAKFRYESFITSFSSQWAGKAIKLPNFFWYLLFCAQKSKEVCISFCLVGHHWDQKDILWPLISPLCTKMGGLVWTISNILLKNGSWPPKKSNKFLFFQTLFSGQQIERFRAFFCSLNYWEQDMKTCVRPIKVDYFCNLPPIFSGL